MHLLAISIISCKQKNASTKKAAPITTTQISQQEDTNYKFEVHYSLLLSATFNLDSVKTENDLKIILFLNRTDLGNLLNQNSIVIPDTLNLNFDAYAPFPPKIKALDSIKKIIFFSYSVQVFVAYENGLRKKWGAVSMGKASTPTPTGLLHTNWKSKKTTSTINKKWVMQWYFNVENSLGVSIHQYSLPGYPASHSCIRLNEIDAYWLYYWADSWILKNSREIAAYGTPIIIYGKYKFKEKPPWRQLTKINKVLVITENEITRELRPFLSTILRRQKQRLKVITEAEKQQ